MGTGRIIGACGVVAALCTAPQAALAAQENDGAAAYRAVVDRYCVACHNTRQLTAGLALDSLDLGAVGERADVWEKVVRKLRGGLMPPAGRPRPDKDTYVRFASWLETELDRASADAPNPGRPVFHRLNRVQYGNAVRDLLGIDSAHAAALVPPNASTHGFDNVAAVLGVDPTLIERYLSAARKLSALAVGDTAVRPVPATYRAPADLTQNEHLDGMPFGTRGGMRARHHFPVDGEYVITAKLGRNVHELIRGLNDHHTVEFSIDGRRVGLFPIGGLGAGTGERPDYDSQRHGGYRIADFEVRAPVKAGLREVVATFLKTSAAQIEDRPPTLVGVPLQGPALRQPFQKAYIHYFEDGLPYIIRIDIEGPHAVTGLGDTESRRRIFVCYPARPAEELSCAREITASLARRAWRRPVDGGDVDQLLRFYAEERQRGGGFEAGIRMVVRALLVSREFLFRVEPEPEGVAPGAPYRLGARELASRLSFFLWSSIPDDELLERAEDGTLLESGELERQVRRMLADDRSRALVENFAGQWLHLRNLQFAQPHPLSYPDFDDNIRQAMRRETELLFETIMREDRNVAELLTADYTFLNERLARHYGITGVHGSHFRRVQLGDQTRHGLIAHGSVLTVTSHPTRTAPVLRGKWILENILGTPPPAPPPDVPDLQEKNEEGRVLSMRERMEQHRANPVCASCHAQMDPLGLALEPFNAVGEARTRSESDGPIDASGVMPDGTAFDGPSGLRSLLVADSERFVHTAIEKLMTYALGRGLEHYDAPAVRAILREAARDDYAFSSIVLGVVRSVPFRMRMPSDAAAPDTPVAARR